MRVPKIVALLITLPACAAVVKSMQHRNTTGPAYAATYAAPGPKECAGSYTDPQSLAAAIAMCSGSQSISVEDAQALSVDTDPLQAAAYVTSSVVGSGSDPQDPYFNPSLLSWEWDITMRVTDDAVATALASSQLPDFMRTDFAARYTAVRQLVQQRVDSLGDHWREVFIKPAMTARADRAAADQVLAPWYDEANSFVKDADKAVLAGKPPEKLVDDALAMRRNYVAACLKVRKHLDRCLGDVVGNMLTAAIHRLATARGDQALDAAEANVRRLDDYSDPRTDEWQALHESFEAERARFAEYQQAKDSGISPEVLAERWPQPPLDIEPQDGYLGIAPAERDGGNYESGDVDVVEEEVRQVKHAGKKATVLFRKDTYTDTYQTNCYETNKVSSVDRETGQVYYEERCSGPYTTTTTDNTKKPVTVPWVEVAHVKAKEIIHVVVDRKSRVGHVSYVMKPRPKGDSYSSTEQVQLREWRQ